MSVGFCDGAGGGSLRFATSELGTPVSCDLTGKAYRLDLQNAQFVQPGGGFGGLLFDALSGDMLMGVESVGDGGVQMLAAFSESIGGQQDYCAPSTELPEAVFDNPSFRVGPVNTGIEVAGSLLTISSLNISGAFAPDCSYFGGGRFEGELDIRQNAPLFGDLAGTEDPDELCSFLGALGVVCEACSSDAAPYCAPLLIDQIVATNTGDPLACVSREYCHPECAANDCADPWNGDCSP
ncbi:MAG TPA: hypothetical protein DFR83_22285 [Deltaproteobacteria bacterium]|nr:hypothetical protein [Deltaproteobacteria bacterium]